jgi:hypothetical protein
MEIVKRNDEINSVIQRLKALICLFETETELEKLQQQQLEAAVGEAPAVYVAAQQALYEHQQQRQVLIEQYEQSKKEILIKLLNIAFTAHYRAI